MKRAHIVVLVAIVIAVGVWWIGSQQGWWQGQSAAGTSKALEEPLDVGAMGRLEPAGKVLDISSLPGDRVDKILVTEGQEVQAGAPLIYLDSRSLRQIEVDSLKIRRQETLARVAAEEKVAQTRIVAARLGVEQAQSQQLEIAAQKTKVSVLKSALALAKKDAERIAGLRPELVSTQDRERQQLLVEKSEAELRAAESLLEKGERTFDLAVAASKAELQAAEAGMDVVKSAPRESLDKAVEAAQAQWDRSTVNAPCKGTILRISARAGELVGPVPLLQMADLSTMVAVAEVFENDVKRVKIGQEALVTSAAFPAPYHHDGLRGKVVSIGRMVATPGLKSFDPLAKVDRHVLEVRVEIDAAGTPIAARFTNLQVDVKLLEQSGKRKAESGK